MKFNPTIKKKYFFRPDNPRNQQFQESNQSNITHLWHPHKLVRNANN